MLLLLDCDHTIRRPASGERFSKDPQDQEIIKEMIEPLQAFKKAGWTLVGITNQLGVYEGHKTLRDAITENCITLENLPELSEIYFCPDFGDTIYVTRHDKEKYESFNLTEIYQQLGKNYRKPSDGMVSVAMLQNQSLKLETLMIGDMVSDRQCAELADINFSYQHEFIKNWEKILGQY